jgi:hypothetical protein
VYAGKTAYACFVEVLANFRQDPDLAAEVAGIRADPRDALYPTAPSGGVPRSWFGPRRLAHADLDGSYVDVQHADSIAALRHRFQGLARMLGFADFDGAAVRSAEPRMLTQQMSRFFWERTAHDGVVFDSRHGSGLKLYAVFERPSTSLGARSSLLSTLGDARIDSNSRDFARALALHNLVVDELR